MAYLNLSIDDTIKKNAEKACADMGLSISTAINMFLVKLGNDRCIPFEVSADPDPFYSKENIERLEKSYNDIKAGRTTEHDIIEV
ncbi:MAG: type II toxin-antitoxin system RelB/DinJ family antitoxin [Firmicutes bacterium]|nr:type II toxin-antitoxin system RelB/DinJ family antitoxin [Bacillota bacterium]